MKMVLALVSTLFVTPVVAAGAPPVLRGHEAPRATDLLRAQKLAEQAKKRRTLPAPRHPGWKRGSGGWDDRGPAPAAPPVVINVRPPAKRP
jgi:hypothetical protein